jgi:sphingolipid delta-4 desaturase
MDTFVVSKDIDVHIIRRKQILAKYPEIEKLNSYDMRPFPIIVAVVLSQLYLASLAPTWSPLTFCLVLWLYGTTCGHVLTLAGHETSHNLVLPTTKMNELLGIFCNCGMGIPSAMTFKRYHMEHHLYMGQFLIDVDLPTYLEGRWIHSFIAKLFFLIFQPLFYAFRPLIIRPKTMEFMDILNWVVVIGVDLIMLQQFGWQATVYLCLSALLMGINPISGHFISEHYLLGEGKEETYSYYGPLNYLTWNVGYHNEHHDFPRVPGWKLPQVRAIAKEFYDPLPHHTSWSYVLWQFLTNPNVSCFNRVIREADKKNL